MSMKERQNWQVLPETIKFLEECRQTREESKEAWARGAYLTEQQLTYALGGINVLDQVIDELTYQPEEIVDEQ